LAAAPGVAIGRLAAIFRAHFGRAAAAGAAGGRRAATRTAMFISPAYAQAASPFGGDSMLVSLLPFVLIFVIMYFLILRPQQRRQKQHADMVKNVRRGDTVVTSGGLIGKVTKVIDDNELEIDLGNGVKVTSLRAMIADVRVKGEPVANQNAKK
jgi:preprotein translocase subunit YajC